MGRAFRRKVILAAACVLAAANLAFAQSAPLAAFEAKVLLNADSSAVVIERIRPLHPSAPTSGALGTPVRAATMFQRKLRVHSIGSLGSQQRLLIDVLEVTDSAGKPVSYHARTVDGWLRIEAPTVRDVTLTYAVRNAVHSFGDQDEFFWTVNPPGTAVDEARIEVVLPDTAAGQFSAQSILRREKDGMPAAALWSSDGRLPVRVAANSAEAVAPGPLAPGVGMVIDVVANKGVFQPISPVTRAWWFAQDNSIVLFPLAALFLMLGLRRVKCRNANAGRSVAPMYSPPEGLSPAEAGVLIADRFEPRDVAATLVDLAVRGYLRIEETAPQEGLLVDRRDFILRLLKPPSEWLHSVPLVDKHHEIWVNTKFSGSGSEGEDGLRACPDADPELSKGEAEGTAGQRLALQRPAPPALALFEQTMLFHTFYGGHWTKLSSLRLRFPEIVPALRSQVMNSLRAKRLYRIDPVQAQKWRQVGVFAVAAALFLAQGFGLVSLFDSFWLAAPAVLASALIVFLLGRDLTAKTLRGMRAYVALLGLQDFITTVEADHLKRMQEGTFEKLLPYAMALGVEHPWAHVFHGIATTAPDWYAWTEPGAFDSILFGHQMGMFSAATEMPHRRVRGGRNAANPEPPQTVQTTSA